MIQNLPNEEWKPIEGFEDYQVSTCGRAKSLKWGKERILRTKKTRGYLCVNLYKEGKQYSKRVHRLVAETFIPNPNNLPEVNHKDENPNNNHVENIEWCTSEYNHNYGTRIERIAKAKSKAVFQYSLDGTLLQEFPSVNEVERQLGFAHGGIASCCRGECKKVYGFIWRYKNEEQI